MAATASIALRKVIEDDIDAGRLQPGDALDEQMLATRFDVSRTPAREALLHLAAVGVGRDGPSAWQRSSVAYRRILASAWWKC